MKVNFRLRKAGRPDKDGRKQIIARISFEGNRVDIYTGYSAKEDKEWNIRKDQLKSSHPDYELIDLKFAEIKKKALDIWNQAKIQGKSIDPKEFKMKFSQGLPKTNSFTDIFEHWIEIMKLKWEHRTIMNYKSTLKFLQDFEKYKKLPLNIDKINSIFFEQLHEYAYITRKVEPNYLFSILKVLKVFMRWAEGRYHNTYEYKAFSVKLPTKEIIYLEFEELIRLYQYPFSGNLCKARDLFCLMSFTGLRVSDVIRISADNIRDGAIWIRTTKGNKYLSIPINQYANEILTRYNSNLPNLTPQKINIYIKLCCKLAGIDKLTALSTFRGGERTITKLPKHDLITNHAARRTFITNSIKLGMHTKVLMNIVGHEKEATMKKYLEIAEETKADAMKVAWG